MQQLQALALPLVFTLFGLIMGSWAGRIPAVRADLAISHSALSMALLCGGLGAVASYPLSAWMMARLGGRKTVLYAGLALLASLVAIGLAPGLPLLMVAVLALGITASCFDVGMNSVAARLEEASGKSEMAKLHAGCCAGGLAGAALGGLLASLHIAPGQHFLMLAAPLACLLWLACQLLEPDHALAAAGRPEKKAFSLPRGPLALLGALGFLGAMSEGSIADWSGVFLKDHFDVGDGFAPLAFAAFSATMLLARLTGDRLKGRHGARRLVSCGAALAAGGLFFAVLVASPYLALAGFAAAGIGLALVFPFVFSAAGREGPVALAGVATMAYSGSLMGPPAIGALAHGFGMQAAIGFIGVLSALIAMVAARAHMLK